MCAGRTADQRLQNTTLPAQLVCETCHGIPLKKTGHCQTEFSRDSSVREKMTTMVLTTTSRESIIFWMLRFNGSMVSDSVCAIESII